MTAPREPMAATVRDTTGEARLILALAASFGLAAAFFTAAVGTGIAWLIGPAIVLGPGAGVIALVFVALSSDTNEPAVASAVVNPRLRGRGRGGPFMNPSKKEREP